MLVNIVSKSETNLIIINLTKNIILLLKSYFTVFIISVKLRLFSWLLLENDNTFVFKIDILYTLLLWNYLINKSINQVFITNSTDVIIKLPRKTRLHFIIKNNFNIINFFTVYFEIHIFKNKLFKRGK